MKEKFVFIIIAILMIGCSNSNRNRISASGTIEATEVLISSQVSGIIKKIIVDEGSNVKIGDTLLIIDDTDLRLQYAQAQAGYEIAEAQYKLVLKGTREEDIAQAEENFKNAEIDLKRIEQLYKEKTVTEKQLDDARTRFNINKQILEKLRRGSRQEEIISARARRDQAKAQADLLLKKVNDCVVISPINGTITKRFAEKGELASAGMALYKISDLTTMDITIYVSEVDLPKVKLNQKAIVNVDAFPEKDFEGKVVFISSIAEFTPKNIQTKDERTKLVFAVKVKVPNPDGILKAGIPADVHLIVNEK